MLVVGDLTVSFSTPSAIRFITERQNVFLDLSVREKRDAAMMPRGMSTEDPSIETLSF
jgi:hypothetical protein